MNDSDQHIVIVGGRAGSDCRSTVQQFHAGIRLPLRAAQSVPLKWLRGVVSGRCVGVRCDLNQWSTNRARVQGHHARRSFDPCCCGAGQQ